MDNRILVIADQLFGETGDAATRFSELLLCSEPSRPLQFVLNAPLPYPLMQLMSKIAFDVIGKQAKRIILGVGSRELSRGVTAADLFKSFNTLVHEIQLRTTSQVYLVTIPTEAVPEVPSEVLLWNTMLKGLAGERVIIADYANAVEAFKEQQAARGKFARTLFGETGKATSMGQTHLALFLQECILKEFKKQK